MHMNYPVRVIRQVLKVNHFLNHSFDRLSLNQIKLISIFLNGKSFRYDSRYKNNYLLKIKTVHSLVKMFNVCLDSSEFYRWKKWVLYLNSPVVKSFRGRDPSITALLPLTAPEGDGQNTEDKFHTFSGTFNKAAMFFPSSQIFCMKKIFLKTPIVPSWKKSEAATLLFCLWWLEKVLYRYLNLIWVKQIECSPQVNAHLIISDFTL